MSGGASVFNLVRESANLAADDALLEVMVRAEPSVAEEAARMLLAREELGGLTKAVGVFERLGKGVQQVIVDGVERMFPAVRKCIGSESAQVCENAISIIAAGGNSRLAYLLSPCLVHTSRRVREVAAAGLVQLTRNHFAQKVRLASRIREATEAPAEAPAEFPEEPYAAIAKLNEDERYMTVALEQALESYNVHYRSEVLEVSLWLANRMSKTVWACAASPRSTLGRGMVEQLLSSSEPALAGAVYQALTHAELRAPVVRMLSRCRRTEFMVGLSAWSWMLGIPRIRKGFGFIRELSWLNEGVDPLLELAPEQTIRMIRVIMATGLSAHKKVDLLRELLLAGKRPVQRAALWTLLGIETDSATETLRSVLSWEDQELSPIALTELMRRQPADLSSLLVRQLGSRSASVRGVAEEEVAATSFGKYWEKFSELPVETRVEAARAMAKVVPDLPRRLRAKLASSLASDRVRALLIIRMLDLCEQMQEYLYRLSHDRDNTVRSAAIGALGQLTNPTAERIARQAIQDTDDRVQANAVEALDEMESPTCKTAIKDQLEADSSRVRANAVKALLKLHVREAAETLIEMLADESHMQRISALWVIERLGLATMIERVVELSEKDPHPLVQARAAKIRGKLERHRTLAESAQ